MKLSKQQLLFLVKDSLNKSLLTKEELEQFKSRYSDEQGNIPIEKTFDLMTVVQQELIVSMVFHSLNSVLSELGLMNPDNTESN